ncbi:MAG TPA: transaldolase family protein [archaeon]|nr:transaldolase family protein [archaeon]
MEIFADTANLDEIRELQSWGVIDGCTTNPKIVAKEGADFEKRMKEILKLVPGPVSIEVTSNDLNPMLAEAKKFAAWKTNAVIKVPMTTNGLKAVQELKKLGIKTNVTACMSVPQLVLAAKSGATYASFFYSRVGDIGVNPKEVLSKAVAIYNQHAFTTKIIVGSIRSVDQITDIMETGAHVITIPPEFFKKMAQHPKTDETIDEFLKFWAEYRKKTA